MRSKKQSAFMNFLENLGQNFQFQDVQLWAQKEFALKQIKSSGISMKQCKSCYQSIKNKYISNLIGDWPDQWHKNQKKVFIQILLCYCKSKHKNPITMKLQQWEYLSSIVFNKNPLFLKFQSFQFLNLQKIKQWKNQYDDIIQEFIQKCGQGNWNQISKMMFYKNKCQQFFPAKQIRQRWNNHIRKSLNKGPWSNEEDRILLEHVLLEGKRWSQITQLFQKSRTQHMIKNRYNFLMNKFDKNRLNKPPQIIELLREIKQTQKKSRRIQKSSYIERIRKKSFVIRSLQPQEKKESNKQCIQKQTQIPQLQNKNAAVQSIQNFELQNQQMLKMNQIMWIPIFNQCGYNQNISSTELINSYIPVFQTSFVYNNLNLYDPQKLQVWQLVYGGNPGIVHNQYNS